MPVPVRKMKGLHWTVRPAWLHRMSGLTCHQCKWHIDIVCAFTHGARLPLTRGAQTRQAPARAAATQRCPPACTAAPTHRGRRSRLESLGQPSSLALTAHNRLSGASTCIANQRQHNRHNRRTRHGVVGGFLSTQLLIYQYLIYTTLHVHARVIPTSICDFNA